MAAATGHRGPDDEGRHADRELAMGMRRLSIIDLSTGHQPIANGDGTIWTVCNGEIYNYREIRAELQAAGVRLRTGRSEEHTSELQSQLRISYAVSCLKKQKQEKWKTPPTAKRSQNNTNNTNNN